MSSIKLKWYDYVLAFVSYFFAALFFNHYYDMIITSQHAYDLIYLTINGKGLSFYSIVSEWALTGKYMGWWSFRMAAFYNILDYIILAVPLVPVYIADHFFRFERINDIILIVSDLTVAFAGILMVKSFAFLCKQIHLGKETISIAKYLLFTSPVCIFVLVEMGQIDAFYIIFILLGIAMYLKGKDYLFALFFSVAIALKPFGLLVFVPLLLLRHKKIIDILKYSIIASATWVITTVPFAFDPGYRAIKKEISDFYGFGGLISIYFVIIICLITAFCYLKKVDEHNQFTYVLLVCLGVYTDLVVFLEWHAQWVAVLIPFVILAVCLSSKSSIMILVDMLLEFGMVVFFQWRCKWDVDSSMAGSGILDMIYHYGRPVKVIADYVSTDSDVVKTIVFGFIVAALLVLLGDALFEVKREGIIKTDRNIEIPHWILLTRVVLFMIINIGFVALYFIR